MLSDFGIATVLEKNVLKNTFCGTLDYASPEIIYGDYYDFSVDLWALGVLTYEICSGLTPYKNDEVKEKRKIFEVFIFIDIKSMIYNIQNIFQTN